MNEWSGHSVEFRNLDASTLYGEYQLFMVSERILAFASPIGDCANERVCNSIWLCANISTGFVYSMRPKPSFNSAHQSNIIAFISFSMIYTQHAAATIAPQIGRAPFWNGPSTCELRLLALFSFGQAIRKKTEPKNTAYE